MPSPRSMHNMCVWNNNVYIFGGYDGITLYNELYNFNPKTCYWRKISVNGSPKPRSRAIGIVYKNYWYIFGGWDHEQYFNDLWRYNFGKIIKILLKI